MLELEFIAMTQCMAFVTLNILYDTFIQYVSDTVYHILYGAYTLAGSDTASLLPRFAGNSCNSIGFAFCNCREAFPIIYYYIQIISSRPLRVRH